MEPARSLEEKVEVLKERFFPPPPEADLRDVAGAQYPERIQCSEQILEQEVMTAIRRPHPDKEPGPDGITNRVLQMAARTIVPQITHLFRACLRIGHHPEGQPH